MRTVGRQLRGTHVRHFAGSAFFNRNRVTVRCRQVDGGPRRGDIERDAVLLRQHGHGISADLVGGVAVGGNAIGADDHQVNVARAHDRAGHVVGDHGGVDAVLHQFPRRQARALQEGPGFIGEHAHLAAGCNRAADHAEGGAVAGGSQRSGVAVRQDAGLRRHHRRAMRTDRPATRDIVIVNSVSFGSQPCLQLINRLAGQCAAGERLLHALDRPEQVDRRRPRRG